MFIGVRGSAQPEASARLQTEPGQERRWEGRSKGGRREEEERGRADQERSQEPRDPEQEIRPQLFLLGAKEDTENLGNFSKQTFLACGEVYLGLVWSGSCAVGSESCAPYTLRKASSLSQVRSPPPSRVLGWGRGQGGVSATSAAAQEQGAAGSLPSPCWLELGAPASTPPQPPNTAASCLSGLLSQQD